MGVEEPWVKNRTKPEDPKILKLADMTGHSHEAVYMAIVGRWWFYVDQEFAGPETKLSLAAVDAVLRLPKKRGKKSLAEAMTDEDVDWLTVDGDKVVIQRFENNFGRSAKRRAQDAIRQAEKRLRDRERDAGRDDEPDGSRDRVRDGGRDNDRDGGRDAERDARHAGERTQELRIKKENSSSSSTQERSERSARGRGGGGGGANSNRRSGGRGGPSLIRRAPPEDPERRRAYDELRDLDNGDGVSVTTAADLSHEHPPDVVLHAARMAKRNPLARSEASMAVHFLRTGEAEQDLRETDAKRRAKKRAESADAWWRGQDTEMHSKALACYKAETKRDARALPTQDKAFMSWLADKLFPAGESTEAA